MAEIAKDFLAVFIVIAFFILLFIVLPASLSLLILAGIEFVSYLIGLL